MGKVQTFKVGNVLYYFFGDKARKQLRKSARNQNIYFVEYRIVDVICNEKDEIIKVIAINYGERLCSKKNPCGGFGIEVRTDDLHVISEDDFFNLRHASDDEIESFCDHCGFKKKEFLKAFEIFRRNYREI